MKEEYEPVPEDKEELKSDIAETLAKLEEFKVLMASRKFKVVSQVEEEAEELVNETISHFHRMGLERMLLHALDIKTSECYNMTDEEETDNQNNID